MSNRKQRPSDLVEALLRAIEPAHRRRKVRCALDDYLNHPSRRDDRGRKSAELSKASTTLRHIVGMQRWVDDERYDLNVRRRIRDFLKHIDHKQPWPPTVVEAREARGLANGAGKAWNEQREYGPGEAVVLDRTHTSYPLNSVAKLRAGGRRGGNCLRDNDGGYHDELRERDAEFHEIRQLGAPVAWLRVELDSRKVTEIYGPSNEEADLPVEVLRQLCRKLAVSGDHEALFLGSGVLALFLDGKLDSETPMRVVTDYRFWWRRGEIVVHDAHLDRWSRFVWRRRWRAAGPSHLDGDAFAVMCRLVPRIRILAWAARPRPRLGARTCRPKRPGRSD